MKYFLANHRLRNTAFLFVSLNCWLFMSIGVVLRRRSVPFSGLNSILCLFILNICKFAFALWITHQTLKGENSHWQTKQGMISVPGIARYEWVSGCFYYNKILFLFYQQLIKNRKKGTQSYVEHVEPSPVQYSLLSTPFRLSFIKMNLVNYTACFNTNFALNQFY